MNCVIRKILSISFLSFVLFANPAHAKEKICGNLASIVYYPQSNPPKLGCLYVYNTYGQTPFWLQVKQVLNDGILVSADNTGIYHYHFYDTKDIFIQTSKKFVDNQILKDDEIVKYIGTYSYINVMGAKRTVHKFYRYGKYEIEKNVDEFDLQKYGFIPLKSTPKVVIQEISIENKNSNSTINQSNKVAIQNKTISTEEVDRYFESIKQAEINFKNNADLKPSEKNDKKFREFLFTYWYTILDINENVSDGINQLDFEDANNTDSPSMWSQRAKNLLKYYKKNGIAVEFDDSGFYAVEDKEYLKSFFKYLTPEYIKWLDFDKKVKTEIGIQDNCHRKLYEIIHEGKDYYNK